MTSYKDRGIVIRRDNFGEADRRVTVYCRWGGKTILLAKSSRRPTSKLAGVVNLLNEIDFVAARTKTIDILTEAQIVVSHDKLSAHLAKTKMAYWACELIDKFTEINEPYPNLYNKLSQTLVYLEKNFSDLALCHFIFFSLKELGYRPEIKKCAQCGRPLKALDKMLFSDAAGGIVAAPCHAAGGRPLKADTIKAMRLLDGTLAQATHVNVSPLVLKELETNLKHFVQFILQRRIVSESL